MRGFVGLSFVLFWLHVGDGDDDDGHVCLRVDRVDSSSEKKKKKKSIVCMDGLVFM